MNAQPKWYDSGWLDVYWGGKDVVSRVAPQKLKSFTEGFDALRTDPSFSTKYLNVAFDTNELARIKETINAIPKERFEMHELRRFGRFVVHDFPEFTQLQESLVDKVSELAGEEVELSYNFLSMYTKMGICEPHLDSPSAKWTLDVCIDQSDPWPIHISQVVPWPEERITLSEGWQTKLKSSTDLDFREHVLKPGSAVLFSGSSQWHYRDPLPPSPGRRFCDLLFFHFIPKGAARIVQPHYWPRHFGIPQLSEIPDLSRPV